jgi:hypothetical protein
MDEDRMERCDPKPRGSFTTTELLEVHCVATAARFAPILVAEEVSA